MGRNFSMIYGYYFCKTYGQINDTFDYHVGHNSNLPFASTVGRLDDCDWLNARHICAESHILNTLTFV